MSIALTGASIDCNKGNEYSHAGTPTRAALEALIANLEGAARGFGFASGLAALSTILMLFNAGDHLIIGDEVYGGSEIDRALAPGGCFVAFQYWPHLHPELRKRFAEVRLKLVACNLPPAVVFCCRDST